MSLWGRVFGGRGSKRAEDEARSLEHDGELARAVDLYLEAELGDEAARVLLLRADAEVEPERRLALCARAAEVAATDAGRSAALGRKARLALDLALARKVSLPSELARIAADLEAAGEHERAADAYALAGDTDGEVRALTAAGAIERLEERLRAAASDARKDRAQIETLARVRDLDACSERREAMRVARAFLLTAQDERVREALADIERRLQRGPTCLLANGDDRPPVRVALGASVTIGRGEATIVVHARAASRRHLEIRRALDGDAIEIEDLGTRNGTRLAGARLGGPLRIEAGDVELALGGEVPCRVEVLRDRGALRGARIEVAGGAWLAPLGPHRPRPGWAIDLAAASDGTTIVLTSSEGAPAFRGALELGRRVELAAGDRIADRRGGPAVLLVLDAARSDP
jgi:hypothetical protein